jgi:predicted PurR-regulated permease PerM
VESPEQPEAPSGEPTSSPAVGLRVLVTIAALFVVIAGLREANEILLPVLVAAFLAVLSIPPVRRLQKRGLPDWAAVLIVFLTVLVAVGLVSIFVGASIKSFSANLGKYEARLSEYTTGVISLLSEWGVEVSAETIREQVDTGQIVQMTGSALAALGSVLSNTLFVLLTVVFILAEAAGLPKKLRVAFNVDDAKIGQFAGVLTDLQVYLSVKTKISLVTGVLAGLATWIIGVDYPVLWALVAFLLNYVPTLGSIIAGAPPVALALVQYGWERAVAVLVAYAVINVVMGSVLEPKMMGRRLGLSSLVVFLSLVFWGFVWGPVGMVLSVPLTMLAKILLEHSDDLKWIAVLLGSGAETRERDEDEPEAQAAAAA